MFRAFNALVGAAAATLLTACASAQVNVRPAQDAGATAAVESISERDFFARIGFLASDALEGRDTPSRGLEVAAEYIASEFYRMGLEPAGDAGTYFQRWPYTTHSLDVGATRLMIQHGGERRTLTLGSDYYVAPGSAEPFSGGIVFVGEGVPAPEVRQNTLRDRIAAIHMTQLSVVAVQRARNAADSAGAAALLVVLPQDASDETIRNAAASMNRQFRAVPRLPVFYLRHDRGRELFRAASLDFDALSHANGTPRPVALAGITAHVGAPAPATVHRPANVVAMLRGSDPELSATYVVFSAHYDHVGVAGEGSFSCTAIGDDRICNGADDDASGTAAIMELAEAYAKLPVRPRRSMLFIAVSGEEKGLLGSRWFADNPTVPVESMIANVNLDMIGRNNPDSVVVIGQTYSSLGPVLHQVNAGLPELRMTVSDDLWPEQRFFFRSDHFNFARREIPSIFFFTGVHEDYHRPGDTVDRIDLDKITRITRLIFHYGRAIADDPQPPRWDPAGLEEVRRLTTQR